MTNAQDILPPMQPVDNIARAEEPMLKLIPYQQDLTPRQGGQLNGKIRIADNFNDFDQEMEEMFNGPLFPEA